MNYHRTTKSFFLLLLILLFTTFLLSAQPVSAANYTISVTVYDPNNKPSQNANVTMTGPVTRTGFTDVHGRITFTVPSGNYLISASSSEYSTGTPLVVGVFNDKSVGITFGYTKAYFTLTPEDPAPNQQVFFNATGSFSSGTIISYQWAFGDGSTGTGPTINHAYTAAGSYLAALTVTSSIGTATYTQIITVGTNVIPQIIAAIVFVFILPLLFIILYNRRQPPYLIIQFKKTEFLLCDGRSEGDCDGTECKMTPC
jgi:hypothetical protein